MNAKHVSATALLILLLVLPWLVNSYVLSVATSVLYLAYVGQAWNIMMGFTGLLSLGHALYIGLGAYVAAGLYTHYGIGPWLGIWVAMATALAFGTLIAVLAFRFSIAGVYFALLTIAFAEFTRIGFDHLDWFGGPGGLFLKVAQRDHVDLLNLRGPPALYYYAILALAGFALALCTRLLRTRAGFYWQAIREDERAAQALGIHTFRWKLAAVALSAALTGSAGVFLAFYGNSLFPEQIFQSSRSIEIMLAPIIGGIGTLLGPLIGALVLTVLGEGSTSLLGVFGLELPGMKQVLYGVLLFSTVWLLPHGIWPALSRAISARGSARP
jgi:branched-chain amino acid transport system permease protein